MVNGVRFTTHAFLLFNNVRALCDEHGIKGSPCLLITYTYMMSRSFPNKLTAKKKLFSSKEESKSLPNVTSGFNNAPVGFTSACRDTLPQSTQLGLTLCGDYIFTCNVVYFYTEGSQHTLVSTTKAELTFYKPATSVVGY